MPLINEKVSEVYESITRPITLGVVRQLSKYMDLPDNTKIIFPGESDVVAINGSTIDNKDIVSTRLNHHSRLTIEMREEIHDHAIMSLESININSYPVFHDQILNVYIKPVHAHSEITVSFTYRAQSRNEVDRWRSKMITLFNRDQLMNVLELEYHYPFPKNFMYVLQKIHELRENQAGYGEDFNTYFNRCVDLSRVSESSNGRDDNKILAIWEKQINVIGSFDFSKPPEPTKDEAGSAWLLNFEYKFSYDLPLSFYMNYPIMVHNQLMPKEYRLDNKNYNTRQYLRKGSKQVLNQTLISEKSWGNNKHIDGIQVPVWDEWLPKRIPLGTSSLFTALIKVNPDNPKHVLNLKDLGKYKLDKDVLQWCEEQRKWLCTPHKSPILIQIYKNDLMFDYDYIYVDEDLNVVSFKDLDLRSIYHIRISIVNDLTLIPTEDQKKILLKPNFCLKLLQTLEPRYKLPRVIENRMVDILEFREFVKHISTTNPMYRGKIEIRRMMVGIFLLSTDKGNKE